MVNGQIIVLVIFLSSAKNGRENRITDIMYISKFWKEKNVTDI